GNHGNDGRLRESWAWRKVAGMTGMAKFQTASSTLCRHSRAGGNPDLKAVAIFKDYLKV
ncbi:hypothetical protein NEIPOLOT_00047, partial [Neisseria polysaccharea ATCC 43768]